MNSYEDPVLSYEIDLTNQIDELAEALRDLLSASRRARAQAYLSEISLRGAEDRAEAALAKLKS